MYSIGKHIATSIRCGYLIDASGGGTERLRCRSILPQITGKTCSCIEHNGAVFADQNVRAKLERGWRVQFYPDIGGIAAVKTLI